MAVVSLTDAESIVKIQLNTSTAWASASENAKKYPATEITKAVQAAHDYLAKLIAQTEGHPDQDDFETTTGAIAHNGAIPDYLSIRAVIVDGKVASEVSPQEIERLRANTLGLTQSQSSKKGFYALVGGKTLYHNGTNAVMKVITFAATPGTGQISEAYLYAIVAKALALLFPHTGQNIEAGQHYKSLADRAEALVIAGQPVAEQQ